MSDAALSTTMLNDARARLERAVSRLEEAATGAAGGAQAQSLARALADVRAENDRLQKLADAVAAGLDSTIARLETALQA